MKKKIFILIGIILSVLITGGVYSFNKWINTPKITTQNGLIFKNVDKITGSEYRFLFTKCGDDICIPVIPTYKHSQYVFTFKTYIEYTDGKIIKFEDDTPSDMLSNSLLPGVSKADITLNEDGNILTFNITGLSNEDIDNYKISLKSSFEEKREKLRTIKDNGSDYEGNIFVMKAIFHNTFSTKSYMGFYHDSNGIRLDRFTKEGSMYKKDDLTFDSSYLKKI